VAQAKLIPRSAQFFRLQRRIDLLWARGWPEWTPRVEGLPTGTGCAWTFSRGFASAVRTAPAAFVEGIDAFFEAAPLLDEVQLDCGQLGPMSLDTMGWLERLFALPAFLKIRTLRLFSLNDAGAIVLSGLPSNLTALELSRTNLGTATYQVLGSQHSSLRSLHTLELSMANAHDVAIAQLFALQWPALRALTIGNEGVGERGMRALINGNLPKLESLDLSWSQTGGTKAIEALAACGTLPLLRELDLSYCEVTAPMALALAGAAGFSLKVLRLAHAGLDATGVRALIDAWVCRGLELLDLSGVTLDAATRALLEETYGERVLLMPVTA